MRPRRYLSADGFVKLLPRRFDAVPDSRRLSSTTYSMDDAIAGAFAMFSLKEPSLLNCVLRVATRRCLEGLHAGQRPLLGGRGWHRVFLFDEVVRASDENRDEVLSTYGTTDPEQLLSEIQYVRDISLNASHKDVRINFLQHIEYDRDTEDISKRFSWVTDIDMERTQFRSYVQVGRSRWKIENETFNTLKNQGYNIEHSYGHGNKNLSTLLMLSGVTLSLPPPV
jgi:hypothetical protein